MAGYSGTPLVKKLGLKENSTVFINIDNDEYLTFFEQGLENYQWVNSPKNEEVDFIHLFFTLYVDMENDIYTFIKYLKKNGSLWVSWPKLSSGIKSDLKRDPIREYLLKAGLVDVKVAAINDQWSGLKFVYRLSDR